MRRLAQAESILPIVVIDSGFAALPRPGMTVRMRCRREDHRMLATPTAKSDSSITQVTNCSDAVGCIRQRRIFSANGRVASKNSGS